MDDNPQITISDLYEGAYLLCRGFKLRGVTVLGNNGKKLAHFAFGEGAKQAIDEYRQGRATCNVALLKFTMNNLKDEMFKKIREYERSGLAPGELRRDKKRRDKCSVSRKRTR